MAKDWIADGKMIQIDRFNSDGEIEKRSYPLIHRHDARESYKNLPFLHNWTSTQEVETGFSMIGEPNIDLEKLIEEGLKKGVEKLEKDNGIKLNDGGWERDMAAMIMLDTFTIIMTPIVQRLNNEEAMMQLRNADMNIINAIFVSTKEMKEGLEQYNKQFEEVFRKNVTKGFDKYLSDYFKNEGRNINRGTSSSLDYSVLNVLNILNVYKNAIKDLEIEGDSITGKKDALREKINDVFKDNKAARTTYEKMLKISIEAENILDILNKEELKAEEKRKQIKEKIDALNEGVFSKTRSKAKASDYGFKNIRGDLNLLVGAGFEKKIENSMKQIWSQFDGYMENLMEEIIDTVGTTISNESGKFQKPDNRLELIKKKGAKGIIVKTENELDNKGKLLQDILRIMENRTKRKKAKKIEIDPNKLSYMVSTKTSYVKNVHLQKKKLADVVNFISNDQLGVGYEEATYLYYNDIMRRSSEYSNLSINYALKVKDDSLVSGFFYETSKDVLENLVGTYIGNQIDALYTKNIGLPVEVLILLYMYKFYSDYGIKDADKVSNILSTLRNIEANIKDTTMRDVYKKIGSTIINTGNISENAKQVAEAFMIQEFDNSLEKSFGKLIALENKSGDVIGRGIDFRMILGRSGASSKNSISQLRKNKEYFVGSKGMFNEWKKLLKEIGNIELEVVIR